MTREEAFERLEYIHSCLDMTYANEQEHKSLIAVDMAIKALEQDTKIIETIDFAINASNGDTNYFVGFRNGLRYAKSLIDGEEEPQFESCTEQELKTGHWINDEDTIGCYYCSECGGYVASYDDAYCKYCGCRMSEVSE